MPSRLRRTALVAALLIGIAMAVFPVATDQFRKTQAAEDLFTAMQPQISDSAIAQARQQRQQFGALSSGLATTALPVIAAQVHETPVQFGTEMAQRYPGIALAVLQMPQILDYFDRYQSAYEREAQTIRDTGGSSVPGWVPPFLLGVLPGVLVAGLAALALRRPRHRRTGAVGIAAVGAVLAASLLVTGLHGREATADHLTDTFAFVFSADGLAQAHGYADTLQAMSDQVTQQLLPQVAARAGTTTDGLLAAIGTRSPQLVDALRGLPAAVTRLVDATRTNEAQRDNFAAATSIPWSGASKTDAYWLTMVPAVLLLMLGALAATSPRARPAPRPSQRSQSNEPSSGHE